MVFSGAWSLLGFALTCQPICCYDLVLILPHSDSSTTLTRFSQLTSGHGALELHSLALPSNPSGLS